MVELATKAANGTYGQSERDKVQDELDALLDDIDRVSDGTNFNGTNLLDGNLSKRDATKAEFKTTLEGLNKTAAKTGKASVQINGKLVEWSVKTANANGNELETDGANAFNDAIKAAGFKDGEFTITYAAGNIEIKAAAAGKNKIKGFKVTGEANEANEGKFKLDAVAKGIGRNAGEVLKLQVGDTNDEFNKISVDVKEMSTFGLGIEDLKISSSLLGYIAGINSSIAKNIVNFREEIGKFTDRNQLKKVPKLGPKAFNQCAGFMRIEEGKNPLDSTAVHPESYDITNRMLQVLGIDLKRLGELEAKDLDEAILREFAPVKKLKHTEIKSFKDLKNAVKNQNDTKELEKAVENMAKSLDVGEFTMKDIVGEIKKKGKDYVEDAPDVVFRADVTTFDDLKIGMEMTGTVRNVVDFGAFVDIGLKNDGLVHISQISDRFIKHPMDAVSVGDVVKVQIIDLDNEKQKIGLTMKIRKEKNR